MSLISVLTLLANLLLKVTWHDDVTILFCMTLIGSTLLGLCYAFHKSALGPLGARAGCRIIDAGYWTGFVIVLLCMAHGSPSAASAPYQPAPAQRPNSTPPSAIQNATPPQYSDPCIPNAMVMRGVPLTEEQKRAEEAACGK